MKAARAVACTAGPLAVCIGAAVALGHVRLRNPSNAANLRWSSPATIGIVVSSAGSDDLPGGLHFPAVRGAIAAWNGVPGSTARLVEDPSAAQQARTDWQSDGLHQVRFDEVNASGYFPAGTGIVALTPVWFAADGRITDADVLFNGYGFSFTTSGEAGAFDVEDVAAHELGHFLGFDHSGWAGATMYPYVDPTVVLHRSLARDEDLAMRDAYPAAGFASITGRIQRLADDSHVAGAHVVARDAAGRTAAGALADRLGGFRLAGLDAGTWSVYATPLDFPVSAANLQPGRTVHVDFESTLLGTFVLAAGQSLSAGDLHVTPDVGINLGRNADRYPLRCVAGATRTHGVRGRELDPGSTLEASDPSLTVTPLAWLGGAVVFSVTVPAGEAPGHVDLIARTAGGERSILPAALEITPADPVVSGVSPASGPASGGTAVTITGSGFTAGSRVVLGEIAYVDGEPGGCTVADSTTILLTTDATSGGVRDAVVIDPSGVEGRAAGAFVFTSTPGIDTVFPAAGSVAGGTRVVLRGSGFAAGCTVRIGGVTQSQVTVDDTSRIVLVTNPGAPGGPYQLEVEDPGGEVASSSYSFVPAADPTIASMTPTRGSAAGGEIATVHGANFAPGSEVRFGADPDTGAGGVLAASTTFIDAGTIEVVTPAHGSGAASVVVIDPASERAAVADEAFLFVSSGGGSGGGCSVSPVDGPRSPLDPLAGSAWLLLVLVVLVRRAHTGCPARIHELRG